MSSGAGSRAGRSVVWVFMAACVVLLAWLGSRGLNEPDEGRFAEIGREMTLRSDWSVPYLNGIENFQKPPLTYWLMAAFMRVFGQNEWAARLPSAVAAIGTVGLAMAIAGELFGNRCRWMTGLLLVTSLEFFLVGRLITTDMSLTFWITAAIFGLVMRMNRGSWVGLALFYLSMGFGFLTKGPLAFVIPGCTAVCWTLGKNHLKKSMPSMYMWLGLPVALLIGLSWYLTMIHRMPALFHYFFGYEFVDRIASNTHDRAKPWWFYPEVVFAGFVPWSLLLPDIIRRARSRCHADDERAYVFAGWIVFPFVILAFVVSKLATYVLPFFPPLAILAAYWWVQSEGTALWRWHVAGLCLLFMIIAAAVPFVIHGFGKFYGTALTTSPALMSVIVFALIALAGLIWRSCKPGYDGFVLPVLAAVIGAILVTLTPYADSLMVGGNATMKPLADYVNKHSDPAHPPKVFMCNMRNNGMEFYLKRPVYRTYISSDVVPGIEPKPDCKARVIDETDEGPFLKELCEEQAYVVVKTDRFQGGDPLLAGWRAAAYCGTCVMLEPDRDTALAR